MGGPEKQARTEQGPASTGGDGALTPGHFPGLCFLIFREDVAAA